MAPPSDVLHSLFLVVRALQSQWQPSYHFNNQSIYKHVTNKIISKLYVSLILPLVYKIARLVFFSSTFPFGAFLSRLLPFEFLSFFISSENVCSAGYMDFMMLPKKSVT